MNRSTILITVIGVLLVLVIFFVGLAAYKNQFGLEESQIQIRGIVVCVDDDGVATGHYVEGKDCEIMIEATHNGKLYSFSNNSDKSIMENYLNKYVTVVGHLKKVSKSSFGDVNIVD